MNVQYHIKLLNGGSEVWSEDMETPFDYPIGPSFYVYCPNTPKTIYVLLEQRNTWTLNGQQYQHMFMIEVERHIDNWEDHEAQQKILDLLSDVEIELEEDIP